MKSYRKTSDKYLKENPSNSSDVSEEFKTIKRFNYGSYTHRIFSTDRTNRNQSRLPGSTVEKLFTRSKAGIDLPKGDQSTRSYNAAGFVATVLDNDSPPPSSRPKARSARKISRDEDAVIHPALQEVLSPHLQTALQTALLRSGPQQRRVHHPPFRTGASPQRDDDLPRFYNPAREHQRHGYYTHRGTGHPTYTFNSRSNSRDGTPDSMKFHPRNSPASARGRMRTPSPEPHSHSKSQSQSQSQSLHPGRSSGTSNSVRSPRAPVSPRAANSGSSPQSPLGLRDGYGMRQHGRTAPSYTSRVSGGRGGALSQRSHQHQTSASGALHGGGGMRGAVTSRYPETMLPGGGGGGGGKVPSRRVSDGSTRFSSHSKPPKALSHATRKEISQMLDDSELRKSQSLTEVPSHEPVVGKTSTGMGSPIEGLSPRESGTEAESQAEEKPRMSRWKKLAMLHHASVKFKLSQSPVTVFNRKREYALKAMSIIQENKHVHLDDGTRVKVEEISDLKTLFEALDMERDGMVTKTEVRRQFEQNKEFGQDLVGRHVLVALRNCAEEFTFEELIHKAYPNMSSNDVKMCTKAVGKASLVRKTEQEAEEELVVFKLQIQEKLKETEELWNSYSTTEDKLTFNCFRKLMKDLDPSQEEESSQALYDSISDPMTGFVHRNNLSLWWINKEKAAEDQVEWDQIAEETTNFWAQSNWLSNFFTTGEISIGI